MKGISSSQSDSFTEQLLAFRGDFGHVYYLYARKPQYSTLEECRKEIFLTLKDLNGYFGQAKPDETLHVESDVRALDIFESDQSLSVQTKRVTVNRKIPSDYLSVRRRIESDKNFIKWCRTGDLTHP